MDLSLFFAGTAGSIPTARRGLPAVLVRRGADRILVDCGEGTQRQLISSVGLMDLTEIFLTHFHADHWLGLPGLLKTFDLRGRERPLAVHGPRGLRELLTTALRAAGRVGFELELIELEPGAVLERDGYRITVVPVSHRGPAFAYAFFEDPRPGVFDPEAATRLGLTPGPDFGRVQRGETVSGVTAAQVMGPPRSGRKLLISGDTRPCEALGVAAYGADVLVHEATFAVEETDRAADTGHSTATQAATLAREAEVRMLALTHFSTRYPVGKLRDEARAIFGQTVLPRDFDTIEIPFPERSAPELIRWEGRKAEPAKPGESGDTRRTGPRSRARPMSADLEQVQTRRLICERLVPAHATELTLLLGDPRVARTMFADGKPLTEGEIAEGLPDKARHWDEHGFGPWLVRDRSTLAMVGRGGLQHTSVAGQDEVEVGWAIVPARWGEGLATELAQASVRAGFDSLGLEQIVAFTLPHNLASRRVMDKSGFTYERDILHVGLPHVLYRQHVRSRPGS